MFQSRSRETTHVIGSRRPDLAGTPTYDFGKWNDGGPDRFVQNNRPAVIDINAFQWPGGCGQEQGESQGQKRFHGVGRWERGRDTL